MSTGAKSSRSTTTTLPMAIGSVVVVIEKSQFESNLTKVEKELVNLAEKLKSGR